MLVYRTVHMVGWLLLNALYRFIVRGAGHVPREGSVVLAANHASFLDPVALGCAVRHRPVRFLARDDLFRIPVLGTAIRRGGTLPIRRGGMSRGAMAFLVSLLRDDDCALLMFPEGTRSADGRPGAPRGGVAAICRAAQVPVVPALVRGSYDIWPRWRFLPKLCGRIEVRFGPPVQWSEEELNASGDPNGALAKLIMKRISDLEETEETPLGFWKGLVMHLRWPHSAGKSFSARGATQRVQGTGHVQPR